ncbi:ATPase, partial [Halorubrum pallidum]
GDGDTEHAYSRHRPVRRAGLIRHAGRGHYAYAVPDLIREAYADRLDDESVDEIVRAVETAFVPPAERSYPPDADPTDVHGGDARNGSGRTDGTRGAETHDDAHVSNGGKTEGEGDEGTEEPAAQTAEDNSSLRSGLSEAAREFVDRSRSVDE